MEYIILLACIFACTVQFIDADPSYDTEYCFQNLYLCDDGTCIRREQHCDNKLDCRDGSDEIGCYITNSPDPGLCKKMNRFLCKDHSDCIPKFSLCNDQSKCKDNSDEENCNLTEQQKKELCSKRFLCDNGNTCISRMYTCDGIQDCKDKTDELWINCNDNPLYGYSAQCLEHPVDKMMSIHDCYDSSYEKECIHGSLMCDGYMDCRDGSDESEENCKNYALQCKGFSCRHVNARCTPTRNGPTCLCNQPYHYYDHTNRICVPADMCAIDTPQCSQICKSNNLTGVFTCSCADGYVKNPYNVTQCYAPYPEPQLVFSIRDSIKSLNLRTQNETTLLDDLKHVHGIACTGEELYWVENSLHYHGINRAKMNNLNHTKEAFIRFTMNQVYEISYDHYGRNIYFFEYDTWSLMACSISGLGCTTLLRKPDLLNPVFLMLDTTFGKMYWINTMGRVLLYQSNMDGSNVEFLSAALSTLPSGMTLDSPGRRIYCAHKNELKAYRLDTGQVYNVLAYKQHLYHPHLVIVFENIIYWTDWFVNNLRAYNKMELIWQKSFPPYDINANIISMQINHPVLYHTFKNPCNNNNCSHLCLVTSATEYVCGCPDDMVLQKNNLSCRYNESYVPEYLVIGSGDYLSILPYDVLGGKITTVKFPNIGRVGPMTFDTSRNSLLFYDALHKSISRVDMTTYSKGISTTLIANGLSDVIDIDYDYGTDTLYIMDAGRSVIEVLSLRRLLRGAVIHFNDEIPRSMCVASEFGELWVAVRDTNTDELRVDAYGLDGKRNRTITFKEPLQGPNIHMKYSGRNHQVFVADEYTITPKRPAYIGERESETNFETGNDPSHDIPYVDVWTSIANLAITFNDIYWTDTHNTKLFWSCLHFYNRQVSRIPLNLLFNKTEETSLVFPEHHKIYLQPTAPSADSSHPMKQHVCRTNHFLCSHICVQAAHNFKDLNTYKCICPSGQTSVYGQCKEMNYCKAHEGYCHRSNTCLPKKEYICDGKEDCPDAEDEEGCGFRVKCNSDQYLCNGHCIQKTEKCPKTPKKFECGPTEYKCKMAYVCIPRSRLCNRLEECPHGDDEAPSICSTHNCLETEFMCSNGACILNTFRCDGESDCFDGSDELNCTTNTCLTEQFRCRDGLCIELKKRCDRYSNCNDNSDEEECEYDVVDETKEKNEPEVENNCGEYKRSCDNDPSICLPSLFWCDGHTDCPDSSDETDCDVNRCSYGGFQCRIDSGTYCISHKYVCDGISHCPNGIDEDQAACKSVNKELAIYESPEDSHKSCKASYSCDNGKCIPWQKVCDERRDCYDGSDESPLCATACMINNCSYQCRPIPTGFRCICKEGFKSKLDDNNVEYCSDIDECAGDKCSQVCYNTPGSYACGCYHDYVLRRDNHTCKAVNGRMSIYYVKNNSVRKYTVDGDYTIVYNIAEGTVVDLDVDVRRKNLYMASPNSKKLIELNALHEVMEITNIGEPDLVTVDWITGNIYFVDASPKQRCIRMCNVKRQGCAYILKIPNGSKVTALEVDPVSRKIFYCLSETENKGVIKSAALTGREISEVISVRGCTGLAVDSFAKMLYVSQINPINILQVNYIGNYSKIFVPAQSAQKSRHGLILFEDYFYYLEGTFKIGRCHRYGDKNCDVYLHRMFDTNAFAIEHKSVQRDDAEDLCANKDCEDVCVMDDRGPLCMCHNGSKQTKKGCPNINNNKLPLFNGRIRSRASIVTMIVVILGPILIVGAGFLILYYKLFRRWRSAAGRLIVGFHAREPVRVPTPESPSPSVSDNNDILPDDDVPRVVILPHQDPGPEQLEVREFFNIEGLTDMIRRSFRRRRRPIPRPIPVIEIEASTEPNSPENVGSDTESAVSRSPTRDGDSDVHSPEEI